MPKPLSSTTKRILMVSDSIGSSEISRRISPPSCVYFTAFDNRLSNIFCKCSVSLITVSCSRIRDCIRRLCPFLSISGLITDRRFPIRLGRCTFSSLRLILPLSIRDMSSTSLIRDSKCPEAAVILFRHDSTFSLSSRFFKAIFVIPIIPFIGVLMSWDMEEKKAVLARLLFCACVRASAS